jgi:hypothetical protein
MDWFDYTSVASHEERLDREQQRIKKLEEEFDAVFGSMYKQLGINFNNKK